MTTAYTDTGEVGSIGSGLIDAIVSPCFRDETGPINAFNPFNPVAIKKARSAPRANCQVGSRCKIKGGGPGWYNTLYWGEQIAAFLDTRTLV